MYILYSMLHIIYVHIYITYTYKYFSALKKEILFIITRMKLKDNYGK